MVTLTIDGKYVVTDGSELKITKENPRLKTSDSYSLDVVLPMSAPENKAVFGNLNRMDVAKRVATMTAVLIADNRTIIDGIAKVTSVTDENVKVQLIGGTEGMGIMPDESKTYIDEIDFPDIKGDIGNGFIPGSAAGAFMGYPGKYAFMPTADTDGKQKNIPLASSTTGWGWPVNAANPLSKLAIQPNLLYVFQYVMNALGYSVNSNALPAWVSHIYIASSRGTKHIKNALPHWTVQEFIDEFEKFFGCTVVVDETSHTIDIQSGDIGSLPSVKYDVVDEYETEITEDNEGNGKMGGNLEYSLSSNDHEVDCLSDDMKSAFVTKEYETKAALVLNFLSLTREQRAMFFFHCPVGRYIYHHGVGSTGLMAVDQFGAWDRTESEERTALKICPVAMKMEEVKSLTHGSGEDIEYGQVFMPVLGNPCGDVQGEHLRRIDKNEDDDVDESDDVSIEDVLFGDEDIPDGEKEDRMQVMLVDDNAHHVVVGRGSSTTTYLFPLAFTDKIMVDDRNGSDGYESWSLTLRETEATSYIGQLQARDYTVIDTAENVFQFLCDGMPDISAVYIFRHKRYLCAKLDITITERGIAPIKTGYFYELL